MVLTSVRSEAVSFLHPLLLNRLTSSSDYRANVVSMMNTGLMTVPAYHAIPKRMLRYNTARIKKMISFHSLTCYLFSEKNPGFHSITASLQETFRILRRLSIFWRIWTFLALAGQSLLWTSYFFNRSSLFFFPFGFLRFFLRRMDCS